MVLIPGAVMTLLIAATSFFVGGQFKKEELKKTCEAKPAVVQPLEN